MSAYSRSQCREWALKFLYQADFVGGHSREDLDRFWSHFHPEGPGVPAYLRELVTGVGSHQEELDALIVRYSEHWRLERMTVVDRNLLRLAALELESATPPKVVIDEAVRLARWFGGPKSPGFVNGILDRLAHDRGRL